MVKDLSGFMQYNSSQEDGILLTIIHDIIIGKTRNWAIQKNRTHEINKNKIYVYIYICRETETFPVDL